MEKNLDRRLPLKDVAAVSGYGLSHFCQRFREEVGLLMATGRRDAEALAAAATSMTVAAEIEAKPVDSVAATVAGETPSARESTPPAAEERCDRCNAAGKLRIVLAGGGDLVFCGHHANQFAPELVKIAVEVIAAPDFDWRGSIELLTN